MKISFPCPDTTLSLHNHTNFSDGVSTPEELCLAARKCGIKTLGISDHWVCVPEGMEPASWSIAADRLDEYFDTLLALKKRFDSDDFTLKLGLEVDFFFENASRVIEELKKYPLDYLIGSVHYSGSFPIDHDASDWEPLPMEERDRICCEYWKKLEGAAKLGAYTFLGHPDLPKKFLPVDNSKYIPHAIKVLDSLKGSNTAIELNTSGWSKTCKEAYPSPEILRAACERNIPVVINADAHHADHLNRDFDRAAALLREAGY